MTNFLYLEYPPPRSWEHFEELCADLFQAMWNDPATVRHGRAGQKQNGVDIVARQGPRYPVGIQCKRRAHWPVSKLTAKEIDVEVSEADKFSPCLRAFYLVTTAQDDTKLQEHVRKLNDERKAHNKFEIVLLGWAEIVRRVTLQPEVSAKHFGAIGGVPPAPLLATWFTRSGVLELTGADFEVAVQELALDLHDHPNGRVVIRQRETDELVAQIKDTSQSTLALRKERIALRRKLKRKDAEELTVVRGIHLMLTDPTVADCVVQVWDTDTGMLVRGFVENELNPKRGLFKSDDQEMHLWPPGKTTRLDFRIKRYFPRELVSELLELRERNTVKWGKPLTNRVLELPAPLRNFHAVPSILGRILEALDQGATLDSLRASGWLNISDWAVEI